VAAEAANAWRLSRRPERAWRGPLRLAWGRLRRASAGRLALTAAGVVAALAGAPPPPGPAWPAAGEVLSRWLFYVTVVPLDMPGAFRRTREEAHR